MPDYRYTTHLCAFLGCYILHIFVDCLFFFFSSRRRHTRCSRDWSSDVCSSDLDALTRNPAKRRALMEGGVGTFVFTGSSLARRSFFKIVAFVMDVAEELLEHAERTRRPFILGISDKKKFKVLAP